MNVDISKLREENANLVKGEAAVAQTANANAQILDGQTVSGSFQT